MPKKCVHPPTQQQNKLISFHQIDPVFVFPTNQPQSFHALSIIIILMTKNESLQKIYCDPSVLFSQILQSIIILKIEPWDKECEKY